MLKYILPLILFIVMAVFLAIGLNLKPNDIPSPLLDKPAPSFTAPKLQAPQEKLSTSDLKGQVWLFNVWASWCVSCRAEHPVLNGLAQHKAVTLIGLNYKDDPAAAQGWLGSLGNPYTISIMDQDGRIGLDWGVYGVPETFVMDKKGIVRYKHTGPVTVDDVQQIFLPLIAKLQAEAP
ncbi:DsbE family thiol:disulfide interchange protein [Methylovulum psychrotolerans]|uniref:DsbE family thiol:disulfide interchange protein n=1 Tax=Methylovulum psychrotolerans TaxID=1704499 RepID=A0A1Z4C2L9_9GAMM|nr:DsbE family thiol:disulfide interchange protein [Methylovulum psychrotolerans]ASF47788.1 DsbE family thiol:disulfide interchange protein [Methylovulum psychrotolerans]MBT9099181.1 DsbE family thiol:disulfide interchange protein [Methylovulum psychrotolerans]POZ50812.1 DsbE family thiol:disulfide interchange protein [Methylovulum psychrotolerans]